MKSLLTIAGLLFVWSVSAAAAQSGTTSPHGALRTGIDCVACHAPGAWKPLKTNPDFDHARQTGFPLDGKHAATSCAGCHTGLRFDQPRVKATQCGSCHVDVHQGKLGATCASCHNTNGFRDAAQTSPHARTAFPLTGAHAQVPCASCHRNEREGEYTRLPATCESCHKADYEAARSPNHAQVGFPTSCQQCHSATRWENARFDHATLARGFALLGAHGGAACSSCHLTGGTLVGRPATPTDCVACHRADFQQEHGQQGYPETCVRCHTQESWSGATFNHPAIANGFALLGAHATVSCASCHAGADFKPIVTTSASDCAGCHQTDYQRVHNGTGFPATCTTCHTTDRWQGARFDHTAMSRGFALVGAHIRATCGACHAPPDGKLRFTTPSGPADCVTCHRPDYDRKHAGTAIPTTCLSCHNNERWQGAIFAHDRFPLTGTHALPCSSCHAPDNALIFPKPSAPTDCYACHRADYERQHTGSGFPTTCISCHTSGGWTGATFNHALVARGFALVGVHAQKPCASCHAPDGRPLFTSVSNTDCVACHRPDYDRKHAGSGYPLTCTTCHAQTAWTDAQFDHDRQYFPIYSGDHAGEWQTCGQCHPAPTSFAVFTCTSCHRQSETDEDHRDKNVTNYQYVSARCLACHPRGDK